MTTKRTERVARELQRELSQIVLYELKDPRIGFITITRVEPTADLKSARVFISVLGNETSREKSLDALSHARGYIQKIIGERMKLRFTPILSFHYDEELEEQFRISKIIEENIKPVRKDPAESDKM